MAKVPEINGKNELAAGSIPQGGDTQEGADGLEAAVTTDALKGSGAMPQIGNDNEPDVTNAEPDEFFHWYNFVFCFTNHSGLNHSSCQYGLPEMKITRSLMHNLSVMCCPNVDPRTIVMLGATYLGYMATSEFNS